MRECWEEKQVEYARRTADAFSAHEARVTTVSTGCSLEGLIESLS